MNEEDEKNKRGSTSFDNRKKFGTEFLDNLGNQINETAFGKFRQKQLNNQLQIQQGLFNDSSELERSLLFPEQNQTEANILEGISDATQIDERISTPLTMLAVGAGAKGLSKLKPKHLGIKQTIEPLPTKSLTRGKQLVNITDQVEEVFNMPSVTVREIIRVAKKNKISYKQAEEFLSLKLKGIEPTGTLNPGSSRETLQKRFMQSPKDRFPDGGDVQNILGLDDTGFSYNIRKKQSVGEYRNKLFNEAGFRQDNEGNFIFDLASLKQFLKGEKRRLASQYFQTRESQSVKGSFEKTRDATKLDFFETYEGYMKLTGSKPNLHHEFAAMVSAPLYDGLVLNERPGSEWMQLTELLNLNNIYPGSPVTDPASLGGPQSNLTQILTKGRAGAPPEPHDILHKQFYKEMGIQDTPKGQNSWWDKRMYKIKSGPKGRLEVAQEYADIVNEGNRIIKTAMSQINALFGKNQDPQKIANLMTELANTGKLRITKTKYRLKSPEAISKIIENEVKADMGFTDEIELHKAVKKYNIDNYADYVDAVDLLGDIADYNESMRVYGIRPKSITKLQHKKNVQAYMKLTQTELELGDVETYKAREARIEDFTYRRVTPLPINKQLEFMFPDPEPTQLEINLRKENPLL
jgi:hypothetical protein